MKTKLTRLAPVCAVVVAAGVIGTARPRAAQQPPPIHGVTGTVATETTIEETQKGARKILSKTAGGIKRLFRLNGRSGDESGNAAAAEALSGLAKGTRVVVHDTAEGQEGTVVVVNLDDRTITVRLADGTRQTLQLLDGAAADAGTDFDRARAASGEVLVYYTNQAGQRVAHYFKRVRD